MMKPGDIILEKYRITAKLTESGGMADIFVGENITLGYKVAVKQLKESMWNNAEVLERFKIEAVAQSNVSHPGIVRVFDYDVENLAIVMEFVDGEEFNPDPNRSVRENVDFFIQTLKALASAHALGVVHRDLKPSNIFLTRDGYTKIADFGIAKILGEDNSKLTMLGVGTPSFMSPEQIKGDTINETSDIYSFGVVMYYVLTGILPFKEKTAQLTAMSQLQNRAKPFQEIGCQNVPPALEEIVFKCLEKDPAQRYASAEELMQELKKFYEGYFGPKVAEASKRLSKKILFGGAAVALALLVGIILLLTGQPSGFLRVETDRTLNVYAGSDLLQTLQPGGGSLKLAPGPYDLVFEAPGFMRITRSVQVTKNEITTLPLQFPDSGTLSIVGNEGESIFLNGKQRGISPVEIELTVGPYEVRIGDTVKQAIVLKGKKTSVMF
jgi:serine/threonine protein kinase